MNKYATIYKCQQISSQKGASVIDWLEVATILVICGILVAIPYILYILFFT